MLKVQIRQLDFISPTHGYAVVNGYSVPLKADSSNNGIYETSDGGFNWKRVSPPGRTFFNVYATDRVVFATAAICREFLNTPPGRLFYSTNDGVTWDSITTIKDLVTDDNGIFNFVAGNRDSLVAAVYFQNYNWTNGNVNTSNEPGWGSTYLVYSTNLGKTWSANPMDSDYHWPWVTITIPPHSCKVIRQVLNRTDYANDYYTFLAAESNFQHWDTIVKEVEVGNWITGSSCALYLANAAGMPNGSGGWNSDTVAFRSTDKGKSWEPLEGVQSLSAPDFKEIDDEGDYSSPDLSVVGHGAILYAGDNFGSIWKTTDGGDGSMSEATLAPRMALSHTPFASGNDTLEMHCNNSLIEAIDQNIGCSIAKFDSISIVGLDPSEYAVSSTHYCGCTSMPDTSFIALTPEIAGMRDVIIHFHFTDDEYNQIDTAMAFTLVKKPSGAPVPLICYFKETTLSPSVDSKITIPVYLSGNTTLVGPIRLTLPFAIDTNTLVPDMFIPAFPGISVGTLGYAKGIATVPLQFSSLALTGEALLGTLRCKVFLDSTLITSVALMSASIASNGPSCLMLSTSTDRVSITLKGCGDSTLLRYMATGSPLELTGITPNPLSDGATISFTLAARSQVAISVIDAAGRETMVLSQEMDAGQHEVAWDAGGFASGVYTCRLRAGGVSRVGKMVVLH